MKTNELMIGDWVRIKSDIEPNDLHYDAYWLHDMQPGQALKVIEILSFGRINPAWYCGRVNDYVPEDAIEPIPLTPEILEENGFENDFYEEESVADYHTIRLEGYSLKHNIGDPDGYLVTWCNGGINVTTDLNGCVQKDISYVHELQHSLRLCGIEKEIAL